MLRDEMPVLSMDIGSSPGVILSRKEDIDFALRHTEIFSSNIDAVDLKNKRPMIPLQIDPPDHKKFRKLLDPIFAPRKMAAMDQEVAVTSSITSSTGSSSGARWTSPRSSPSRSPRRSSSRCWDCRMDELDTLPHHEGRHHPPRRTSSARRKVPAKAQAYQQKIADSVYEYFDKVLDEREMERGTTSCRTS